MKFVIPRAQLLELVGRVQSIVSSAQKAMIPILSNVLIEAANDELVITSTDLTVGIRCFTEAKILQEGATTVPARRFFQLIKELPDVNVEISTDHDDVVSIVAGASRFKLHGMSRTEFPELPDLSGAATFRVSQKILKDLLYRTSFAVSREDNRYVLTGVYCRMTDGKATFIATDGKRVAKNWAQVEVDNGLSGAYVLPFKAVEEIIRGLSDEDDTATVHILTDRVAIEAGRSVIITKLLTGDYPQVDEVIPQSPPTQVVLHREELISLLRQVSLFTSDANNSVRFSFAPGELTVSANTMDIGEGRVNMPVNFEGQKLDIAFNPNYFLDILKHSHDETVTLGLTDSFNPGLITDSSDGLFMLMPVRLSE